MIAGLGRALAGVLALGACGFEDAPSGEACVPGEVSQCACPGGTSSTQTCGDDGAYSPCACPDEGNAASNAGSGTAGSSTMSGGAGSGTSGSSGAAGSGGSSAQAGTGGAGAAGSTAGGGGESGAGAGGSTAGSGGSAEAGAGSMSICTPGEFACEMRNGSWAVTHCNDTGSAFRVYHVCQDFEYCEEGACHTRACSPGQVFCEGNELRKCDELGKSWSVEQTCTDGQLCSAQEGGCVTGCQPIGCACNGGGTPCCLDDGSCGCSGFLGLQCSPVSNMGMGGGGECTCP